MMLIDLLYALFIIVTSGLVGNVLLHRITKPMEIKYQLAYSFSGGLATLLLICYLSVYFNISPEKTLALISFFTFASFVYFLVKLDLTQNVKYFLKQRAFLFASCIPMIFFAAMGNRTLLNGQISVRNGPDLIGWLTSARYLCIEGNLQHLKNSVFNQSGANSNSELFASVSTSGVDKSKIISAIPSAQDQYASEFLIGADRLGLPGLQASICKVFGPESLKHSLQGATLAAIFLSFLTVFLISREMGKSRILSLSLSVVGVANVSVASVFFEGGIGQVLTQSHFLLLVSSLIRQEHQRRKFYLALLISAAASVAVYQDLFLFVFLFLCVYFTVNFWDIYRNESLKDGLKTHLSLPRFFQSLIFGREVNSARRLMYFATTIPLILIFYPLAKTRVSKNGIVGGWDFGRFPYLGDFLGYFNWIPNSGNSADRSSMFRVLEIVFVIALILISRILTKDSRAFFKTVAVTYLFFIFLGYARNEKFWNSYSTWKAGLYIAPVYWATLQFVSVKAKTVKAKTVKAKLLAFLIAIALGGSINWGWSYWSYSAQSFDSPSKEFTEILQKNDIWFSGIRGVGAGSALIVLQGDVHYLNSGRSAGIPTKFSSPARPLLYVIHRSYCQQGPDVDKTCAKSIFGLPEESTLKTVLVENDLIFMSKSN
jgi:uncharacterized membrane protein YwzB